jgi:hypothetical protein
MAASIQRVELAAVVVAAGLFEALVCRETLEVKNSARLSDG